MTLPIHLEWLLFPILALALYGPCLNGELIYDDMDVADSWKMPWAWWWERPLTTLLYRLTHLWPGTLRGHHVTNVLIHSLNALIVGKIASQIGINPWVGGLIFLCHPFAVNAVAYISGLASLLSTLAGLGSILAILNTSWILAAILAAASVMAKPDGIAFFLTATLLAYLTKQTLVAEIGLALIAILALPGYCYFRKRFDPEKLQAAHVKAGLPGAQFQPEHAMTVLVHTLRLIFPWMLGLGTSPKHGGAILIRIEDYCFALFTLSALAMLAVVQPIPMTLLLVGPWLVYVILRIHEPLVELRNYAMVAGFSLLAAQLGWMVGPLFVWFTYRTVGLSAIFSSSESFWARATQTGVGEKSHAWMELGASYQVRREFQKAEPCFRRAILHNPDLALARKNLAWCLVELGQFDEGLFQMHKAAVQCPHHDLIWEDLALMNQMKDRLEEAEACAQKATDLAPHSASAWNRRGVICYLRRRFGEARTGFEHAIDLDPNPAYRFNLAITQKAMGLAVDVSDMPAQLRLTSDMIPPQMKEVAVNVD